MQTLARVLKACLEAGSGTDAAQFTGGRSLGEEALYPGKRKKKRRRKPPLGSGERFAEIEEDAAASGARDPAAVAAAAGRRKYGKKRMAKMAAAGRARKSLHDLIDAVRRGA